MQYATDESEYDKEDTLSLNNSPLSRVPSNVSYSHTFSFSKFDEIKPGTYKMKIKVFYGKSSKVSESEFFIKVVDEPKIIEIIKDPNHVDTENNIESIETAK